MSRFFGQIKDFSKGKVGVKNLFRGDADEVPFFNGFTVARELWYYGRAIFKRPPLEHVSTLLEPRQELDISFIEAAPSIDRGKPNILLAASFDPADDSYRIIYTQDGKLLPADGARRIGITSVSGEDSLITITTDAPLTKGAVYETYIKEQKLDAIEVTDNLAATNTYEIQALAGEKLPMVRPGFSLLEIKTLETTQIDYNDSVLYSKYRVYIRDTGAFFVDENGDITTTPTDVPGTDAEITAKFKGKSATTHKNFVIVGEEVDSGDARGLEFKISRYDDTTPQADDFLLPYYGRQLYWVRDATRGIVFATDQGIFYGVLGTRSDGKEGIVDIILVSRRQSADIRPVVYRDFLLYIDRSRRAVMFVAFDRDTVRPVVDTLVSAVDLLDDSEFIKKIDIMHFNDIAVLLMVTRQGKCLIANIQLKSLDIGGSLSFAEWFTSYKTNNVKVIRNNDCCDTLIWAGEVAGVPLLGALNEQPAPLFRRDEKRENRDPHLDFFRKLEQEKLYPDRPTLSVLINDDLGSATIDARSDFFSDLTQGIYIGGDENYVVYIGRSESPRRALGTIKSRTDSPLPPAGSTIVFRDYNVYITRVPGLSYLYAITSTDSSFKVFGADVSDRVRDYQPLRELPLQNVIIFPLETPSDLHVGIAYTTEFVTAPLTVSKPIGAVSDNYEVLTFCCGYTPPLVLTGQCGYGLLTMQKWLTEVDLCESGFYHIHKYSIPGSPTKTPTLRLVAEGPQPFALVAITLSIGVTIY